MSGRLPIWKMQAAGNDFVVVADMRLGHPRPADLARRLCKRVFGLGADGLILLQPSRLKDADYRMRIINSDGSEAEMCGNGSRCAVQMAYTLKIAPKVQHIETVAGLLTGRYLKPGRVRVQLTDPSGYRKQISVQASGKTVRGSFINTGVPHFVVFVPNAEKIDVRSLGRVLRYHQAFGKAGTNVNFVTVTGPAAIHVRTYERGVEDETLACGTGATACGIIASLERGVRRPVSVLTTSGMTLKINFREDAGRLSGVTMEGPCELVYEASVPGVNGSRRKAGR